MKTKNKHPIQRFHNPYRLIKRAFLLLYIYILCHVLLAWYVAPLLNIQ